MGGSSRAQLSLSSSWNLATYRVLCNSQYSWSSVRYPTPQSSAGWERGRGLLRLEAGVESYCSLWLLVSLVLKHEWWLWWTLPSAESGGRRGGGKEESWGVKTKMEYLKQKYIFAGWVGPQTNTGRTQSSRIKANNSKHSLTHTHTPIKTAKQKKGKQASQSNHTKWHQAFPKWHQVSLFNPIQSHMSWSIKTISHNSL